MVLKQNYRHKFLFYINKYIVYQNNYQFIHLNFGFVFIVINLLTIDLLVFSKFNIQLINVLILDMQILAE